MAELDPDLSPLLLTSGLRLATLGAPLRPAVASNLGLRLTGSLSLRSARISGRSPLPGLGLGRPAASWRTNAASAPSFTEREEDSS